MASDVRHVTPEQLKEGYTVLHPDGRIEQRKFVVVHELPDGTAVVREPESMPDADTPHVITGESDG